MAHHHARPRRPRRRIRLGSPPPRQTERTRPPPPRRLPPPHPPRHGPSLIHRISLSQGSATNLTNASRWMNRRLERRALARQLCLYAWVTAHLISFALARSHDQLGDCMSTDWKQRWQGKWVLITGASAGIGLELAKLLAANGADLVLTARRTDRLQQIATELKSAHNVQIEVCSADLTKPEAPQQIYDFTTAKKLEIEFLIN